LERYADGEYQVLPFKSLFPLCGGGGISFALMGFPYISCPERGKISKDKNGYWVGRMLES
jgi:hypothetical protein